MRYYTIICIQYKKGDDLYGKFFNGENQIKQARKFAGEHNTYNAITQIVEVRDNIPEGSGYARVISESPFPFKRFGDWVISYTPGTDRK
jgi:hypothetical protein